MKNAIVLFISLVLLALSSCKNEEKQPTEEIETIKNENVDENITKTLISGRSVGEFTIGNPISGTSKNFEIEKGQQTRMTEGGPSEETIYTVSKNGKKQLVLKPQFDQQKNGFNNRIGGIMVISERYNTKEGIGVNSTIAEFQKAYPDFKIWYTYVSDRYVLETPKLPAQFLLNKEHFVGEMEINSVQVPLKPIDFKEGAKIKKIRIFN